ncbi:MAG TPA: aminotransferase class V-fold PLP-dependent enzyme [Actinophytocola sp.]|uniref:pyridoxal phosphate-dependent decarboxylase family protein n=1 Tax=Actinophytocola sp. TaxID=1872138 RepID=UPI002DB926CD|nr:aminotransferase class V-fold PLP-dependent enzyme [Actinophytocola sp.]HEU5472197.1 aminotransferase class V-fold PLP-dependent enzyme [Actinophytocola sp.]
MHTSADVRAHVRPETRPRLAGGVAGAEEVLELVETATRALADGAVDRSGPAPAGGPAAVAAMLAAQGVDLLPDNGIGAEAALRELTRLLAAGSVDPSHPWCAAHLHGPPLAVAAVADLVAAVLNPSMDSWDQAPMGSELERELTAEFARLCFPAAPSPDAVVTSGGTESNVLGLLLARQTAADQGFSVVRTVCGANAHHSVARAAWLLGLPSPIVVPCHGGRMRPDALAEVLADLYDPAIVVATAGTTDAGVIDPLPRIAELCRSANAFLHVDAAYGGGVLCSARLRPLLDGLELADTVSVDLHKFGWQPIAAGLLAVRDTKSLTALDVRAEYLNAADDTEAGLPDLLGRSLRTSRRADVFKIAVTLRALGRSGLAGLVERCCATAAELAGAVAAHPGLRLWGRPDLSTVLVRPLLADELAGELGAEAGDILVARVRRRLLEDGVAVLGRASAGPSTSDGDDGASRLWLKLTLLHPTAELRDYLPLLDIVAARAHQELESVVADLDRALVVR